MGKLFNGRVIIGVYTWLILHAFSRVANAHDDDFRRSINGHSRGNDGAYATMFDHSRAIRDGQEVQVAEFPVFRDLYGGVILNASDVEIYLAAGATCERDLL